MFRLYQAVEWAKWAGGYVVNPLTLSISVLWALFALSNLYRLVPSGGVENHIAAFRVNTFALLVSIILILACLLIYHPHRTLNQAAGKIIWALILLLQVWEVGMTQVCKMAENPIIAETHTWGIDTAKDLCGRTIGNGPLYVQIGVAILISGWILCRYLKIRKAPKV